MAAEQPIYRVGERVDGLYDENTDDMWYPGRIRCVHHSEDTDSAGGPTYEVLYDDGEVEMHVRLEFLRQHVPCTICVGTRVLCRYDGGEEFYPGQVSDVQENGMYTIAYDDGEVEEDVPLDHIIEPNEDEEREPAEATQEEEDNDPRQDEEVEGPEGTQQEEAELEDVQGSHNPVDADSATDMQQENDEDVNTENNFDESIATEKLENAKHPSAERVNYVEAPKPAYQKEDHSDPTPEGVSAERTYIKESLQLLEKRLGDAASTKSVLSTLVKQMRAYPQITADLLHERGGERLIIDSLKFHQSHAVIQCYGFVLLRRLCFLCVESTHYLLRNGIVELVIQAMNSFSEDAILQASACGALAVFTRVHAGLNNLIEYQVAQLVLSTLIYHKTYSVHTRQVHYYACEVLLELCELDDLQTLNLLCGEQEEDFTGDMSPVSLLLFLLRQGLSLDDKKACCAVGSLLMCLAASGRRAAALILSLNGLAELSTVMARYPTEPSIQKYSAAASKQIAMCSVRQSPTKKIKDTATEILREAESLETTPADRQFTKRSVPQGRSTSIGKRKSNPYGAPAYPRGAAYSSGTPHRNGQSFSKVSSPYGQGSPGFGGDTNFYGYPASSTAPQQPSSLVILDGSLGMDSGFGSTNKRELMSKEDRQSELFDAYGIQGMSNSSNGRPYGTKRAQLKAHLASAESTWAAPQQREIFHTSSHNKPYSSRSEHLDHAQAYSHRDFLSSRQNRWDYGIDEPQNPVYDSEVRPNRGAKRKKKTPGARTAFQVRIENENQIRVSRETRSPYPSPQRLGVATERAAKARQKRLTGGANSSLAGRSNNPSSESLNDYATQLFQDNAVRAGTSVPTSSKLTPREKEEIRERERLSFAEKLHKMIDKAKSTLANGNTTSIATGHEAIRSQKLAVTKAARKTREPSADEKRPLSKKTRTVGTSKNATKEDVSLREAVETRPPKPTSGLSKRQVASNDAGVQQPVGPRSKPIASRSVVTPKGTTDSKPRTAVKSSRAPTSKFPDKQSVGKTRTPGEVASSNAPVVDEPPEVQPVAVVSELAAVPAQSAEQVCMPLEMLSSNQIEPSSETAQVEASAVSEEAEAVVLESEPASSELEADLAIKTEDEPQSVVPCDEENAGLSGKDGEEEAIVASEPVEIDVVAHSEDAMASIEQDCERENGMDTAEIATPVLSESPADADYPSVSPMEEPSDAKSGIEQPRARTTVADAMYGDDYSEFDDNGGDDDDIGADTDEPQILATETSEPVIEVHLQESRSGEALYEDGSNEFDDDEAAEETEEVPAAEIVDNQGSEASDTSFIQVAEGVPDPLTPEMKSDHLEAEGEKPEAASAEETVPAPAESEDGFVHDINAVNSDASADVVAPESEYVVTEPEESQDQPSTVADDDNASHEDANQNDLDSTEANTEGKPDENIVAEVKEDGAHVDPVHAVADENTGGSTTLDNEVDTAGGEKVDDTEIDTSAPAVELTETEGAGENSDPGIQPINLDAEIRDTAARSEAVVSNDCDVGEMFAGPDSSEDSPAGDVQADVPAEEPLTPRDSLPLLEQDDEKAKYLVPNSSDASIQSAGYDEENFDEEETHQDVEATDTVEGSVVSQAEEAVDLVDQQLQEVVASENAEAPENTDTANAAATTADGAEEDESKVLLANSSEQSIQSAAYGDDDFDDGAHDDFAPEKSSDNAEGEERVLDEPQSSPIEVTDNTETNLLSDPVAPDDELVPAPEVVGEDDKAQDVLVDGEELSTVILQEAPEQQQLDHSDSTSNAESGSADAISPVIIESEAPVETSAEVADDDAQAPLADEAEQYDDDSQIDNADEAAPESENSSATTVAEDSVAPLPATADSSMEPSAESEVSAIESPENSTLTDAAPAQEPTEEVSDAGAQPATYDDADFENGEGGEQTKFSATLDSSPPEEERVDESSQDTSLDVQPSSEQTSAESDDTAITEVSSINDPSAVPEVLPEAELQATNDSEKLADESSFGIADEVEAETDATSDLASGANVELQSTDDLVDNTVDQARQSFTPDDAGASSDKATSPESETSSLDPELQPFTPGEDQKGQCPPNDFEPESAAPVTSAVDVPELASQPEALPSDETGLNAVDTTQSCTTEMPADSQCYDAFDGDQEPAPTPVNVTDAPVENLDAAPVDLSVPTEAPVDSASEEAQYEDAEFDDVGNDAATEKDEVCENEVAPSESGAVEGGSPAAESNADELPSIEIAQAQVIFADVDNDDTEVTEGQAVPEEAADPAKQEKEDTSDLPEAAAGINEDAGTVVDEKPSDDTGEGTVDHSSGDADIEHESINATEAEVQDAISPPDATAYDEDFPPESSETHEGTASDVVPEAHEDVEVDANSSPVEKEVSNDDGAVIETESPAATTGEAEIPGVSADDMARASVGSDTAPTSAAKEEQYDDGFDDENTPADPSDAGSTTDAPTEVDPVDTGDADAPGNAIEAPNDTGALESEQLNEDQAGKEEGDHVTPESIAQEESAETTEERDVGDLDQDAAGSVVEPEVVESEDVVSEATKIEEAEVETVAPDTTPPESAELESLDTEAVESKPAVPESAGCESVAPNVVEQKSAEPVVGESDSVENSATEHSSMEIESVESVVVDPEVVPSELIESNTTESETTETKEPEVTGAAAEPEVQEAAELETEKPTNVGLETTDSEAVEAASTEPEAVVSEGEPTITVDPAAVSEPPLESPSVDPVPVESVLPEASNEEPTVESLKEPTPADSLTTEDESKSTTETVTEVAEDTPVDISELSRNVGEERAVNEAQEDESDAVIDPPETIEVVSPDPGLVDSESAPPAEEVLEPSSVDASAPGSAADGADDIGNMTKDETAGVNDGAVDRDADSSEPTETTVLAPEEAKLPMEDAAAIQDDYEEADPPAAESDIETSDATEVDKKEVVEEESPSNQNVGEPTSDSSEVQEKVIVPVSSEVLAIEVDPPETEEAYEDAATPAAASEGPKTEDQYDDDNGYDDFDDQDHDEAAEPTIEVPVPVAAATEAPPTEDDYEDYENEDYGEEEKPVDILVPEPVVQPSSSRSEPPTSAREEEIEEVADEPEEAEEEAYADEDEYNNEYEEDDTPAPVPAPESKSPSPQKEPSPPRAEESADEYEDDNEEEEYAEDDVEERSPRPAVKEPPAPVVSTKPDVDEMDDEVGYDSEYADSDS